MQAIVCNVINRWVLCVLLTACSGCDLPRLGFPVSDFEPIIRENISYADFQDVFGNYISIPTEAFSISAYHVSWIDASDTRVLMKLPPSKAEQLVASIQEEVGWGSGAVSAASERIQVESIGSSGILTVRSWENRSHSPPRWWSSITADRFSVAAFAIHADVGYLWLFNVKDSTLVIWRRRSNRV